MKSKEFSFLRLIILLLLLAGAATFVSMVGLTPDSQTVFENFRASSAGAPPDPTEDIPWSGEKTGAAEIQAAFNRARSEESEQLGTTLPPISLPEDATWGEMSDGEKMLWLVNRERIDRGIAPLQGLNDRVSTVAQDYANYLLENDVFNHQADGNTPWERLTEDPEIDACHDFLGISENLAVFVTSGTSVPLPIEQSVYDWMYNDSTSEWGHRHAILWHPYNENSGPSGQEGFLGVGRANGGPYQGPFAESWNYAEVVVMNVFDPCDRWEYGLSAPAAPRGLAVRSAEAPETIVLTWEDTSDNEEGFRIEASFENRSWVEMGTVVSNTTAFTGTGHSQNAATHYRVRAYNAAGTSAYSNIVTGTLEIP